MRILDDETDKKLDSIVLFLNQIFIKNVDPTWKIQ
jgi:hypothetical protein